MNKTVTIPVTAIASKRAIEKILTIRATLSAKLNNLFLFDNILIKHYQ